jgi:hypothetical protein
VSLRRSVFLRTRTLIAVSGLIYWAICIFVLFFHSEDNSCGLNENLEKFQYLILFVSLHLFSLSFCLEVPKILGDDEVIYL